MLEYSVRDLGIGPYLVLCDISDAKRAAVLHNIERSPYTVLWILVALHSLADPYKHPNVLTLESGQLYRWPKITVPLGLPTHSMLKSCTCADQMNSQN